MTLEHRISKIESRTGGCTTCGDDGLAIIRVGRGDQAPDELRRCPACGREAAVAIVQTFCAADVTPERIGFGPRQSAAHR